MGVSVPSIIWYVCRSCGYKSRMYAHRIADLVGFKCPSCKKITWATEFDLPGQDFNPGKYEWSLFD